MGYALATELYKQGANLTVISGPVQLDLQLDQNIRFIAVKTAAEMYQASLRYYKQSDISIFAAAVADYKPATTANQKIKKKDLYHVFTIRKN